MKSKKTAILFILPFLLFFVAFWIAPFIFGGYMSLHKYSLTSGDGGFVGMENFNKILLSDSMYHKSFLRGMKNTLIFVACTVPFLVTVSLALAIFINRLPEKARKIFRTIYFASYSVSVTAVSATFVWLMRGNGGYLNNLLIKLKIISSPIMWLEREPYVWITLTIATIWWTVGYNMMLYINALNEIDEQMYEAASIDGAGFWKSFIHITMPNIRSTFFFVLMITVIASFNVYGQPRLITQGGPAQATKPIIMEIYTTILQQNNLGIGNAMALLMGIVIVVCSICQYYMTREKENL